MGSPPSVLDQITRPSPAPGFFFPTQAGDASRYVRRKQDLPEAWFRFQQTLLGQRAYRFLGPGRTGAHRPGLAPGIGENWAPAIHKGLRGPRFPRAVPSPFKPRTKYFPMVRPGAERRHSLTVTFMRGENLFQGTLKRQRPGEIFHIPGTGRAAAGSTVAGGIWPGKYEAGLIRERAGAGIDVQIPGAIGRDRGTIRAFNEPGFRPRIQAREPGW